MHNEPLMRAGAARSPNRKPQTRALVPVADSARAEEHHHGSDERGAAHFAKARRQAGACAGFVTQLIACAGDLPAYRARRRAEPGEAARRYADAQAHQAPRRGIAV